MKKQTTKTKSTVKRASASKTIRNNQVKYFFRPSFGNLVILSITVTAVAVAIFSLSNQPGGNAQSVTACTSTTLVGHRGTNVGVRENTIAAFKKAIAEGADTVEMDIRRTKPDSSGSATWIVNHDASISGLTISSTTYAALKAKRPDLATYREALKYVATTGKRMQVEIKPTSVSSGSLEAIAKAATDYNMQSKIVITSFQRPVLENFHKYTSGIKTGFISREYVSPTTVKKFASSVILERAAVTASRISAYRNAAIKVEVWTADSEADWSKYVIMGVDGVITNKAGAYEAWCRSVQT